MGGAWNCQRTASKLCISAGTVTFSEVLGRLNSRRGHCQKLHWREYSFDLSGRVTIAAAKPNHPFLFYYFFPADCSSIHLNLISTALRCASNSSTFANCITAPPTSRKPCWLSSDDVMCLI